MSSQNEFVFLYATDIHLGHQVENVIEEAKLDAFTAFEEILQYAKNLHPDRDENEAKVDCLLQGMVLLKCEIQGQKYELNTQVHFGVIFGSFKVILGHFRVKKVISVDFIICNFHTTFCKTTL